MQKIKQYTVPVMWSVGGTVTVSAYSKKEAIFKVVEEITPTCADNKMYIDDSWQVTDEDDIEVEIDDDEDDEGQ